MGASVSFPNQKESRFLGKRSFFEYHFFDDVWRDVLCDWFMRRQGSPFERLPSAVVVPNESAILFIKQYLLKNDISLLGVRFFTPGTFRHYLLEAYNCSETLELRENLHLLMKVASRHFADSPVASAAEMEPEQFVRLADLFETTGWNTEFIKNFYTKPLIERYFKEQESCGLTTAQKITDILYTRAQSESAFIFSNLLICGFRSKHWANYKMLFAGVRSSQNAVICFLTQDGTRLIDQGWLGSWEQELGFAQRITSVFETPFSYLSYYFEDGVLPKDDMQKYEAPEILIAEDILREAELIVARIASALVLEKVTRLGVVFPNQTSPLAREVSRLLESEGIFHHNHLGYLGGSSPQQKLFESWVHWQKTLRLGGFLAFLDQLVNEGLLSFEQYRLFNREGRLALQNTLTDELRVILSYLKNNVPEEAILSLLDAWVPLPEEAFFSEYVKLSQESLRIMGWPEDVELIKERAGFLLERLKHPIKKGDYLSWLSSITKPLGRIANYFGKNENALVHLITEEEAIFQNWSHLILAGLNRDEWPGEKPEILFLDENEIFEFNQMALIQGHQGEGHLTIKPGFSLFPSKGDHYAFNKSNFSMLLGMPSKKLILTAHLKDPQKSNDSLLSEYLERVYWIYSGVLLDAARIGTIHQNTNHWMHQFRSAKLGPFVPNEEVLLAYNKRRERESSFDEYSFCFKNPTQEAFNLPSKVWEDIVTMPERAWFNYILGVKKDEVVLGRPLSALAQGTWIHSWLNLNTDALGKKMDLSAWVAHIHAHADKVLVNIDNAFKQIDQKVPDIWKAHWHEARRTALVLANALSKVSEEFYFFSEFVLPELKKEDVEGALDIIDIPLKGRLDLIAYPLSTFEDKTHPVWIIDYKTGLSGTLTQNKLKKGVGLQLALYALAFKRLGFSAIDLSILQPNSILSKQLNLNEVLECQLIIESINSIYRLGKLGIRGSMKNLYGFGFNFPLATLKIDNDIIVEKWNLTHPFLSRTQVF